MGIVSQSKAQNKIVILDSCFSGAIGNHTEMPNYSLLKDGTTILSKVLEVNEANLKYKKMNTQLRKMVTVFLLHC